MAPGIGSGCYIYRAICEVDSWATGAIPDDRKLQLVRLRRELLDLDKTFQENRYDPLTRNWTASQVFTPETIAAIDDVNRIVRDLQRGLFERAWGFALESAAEIGEKRLERVYADRHDCARVASAYRLDRRELLRILRRFNSPQFVDQIFLRWRVFDVKLNKLENRWCFVLTDPYKHVAGVLDDFITRKPHEIDRALEYAFTTLLGVHYHQHPCHEDPSSYSKHHGWYVQGDGHFITHPEMDLYFKSCRAVYY